MPKIPKKINTNNSFLYGRFVDTDDMMDAIVTLEDMCVRLQRENAELREMLGQPVSKFRYNF
jgi:hypothetical protein